MNLAQLAHAIQSYQIPTDGGLGYMEIICQLTDRSGFVLVQGLHDRSVSFFCKQSLSIPFL